MIDSLTGKECQIISEVHNTTMTWKQKTEILSEYIMKYYADTLRKAGYVTFRDAGFHWYKVRNGILYTIMMPLFSPRWGGAFEIGIGAIPLFSWEYIAYTAPRCDWGYEFNGGDYCRDITSNGSFDLVKEILGSLPRSQKEYQGSMLFDYKGVGIEHWFGDIREITQEENKAWDELFGTDVERWEIESKLRKMKSFPCTERDIELVKKYNQFWNELDKIIEESRHGVEIFEEIAIPFLNKLDTIEKVYRWNVKKKLIRSTPVDKTHREWKTYYITVDEFSKDEMRISHDLSMTFADQCLYCQGEKWYPIAEKYLRKYCINGAFTPNSPCYPKTKKDLVDYEATKEHARVLIRVIETGDRELLRQELIRNRERMERHIREKLPDLSWENIEPDPLDEKVFR